MPKCFNCLEYQDAIKDIKEYIEKVKKDYKKYADIEWIDCAIEGFNDILKCIEYHTKRIRRGE